MYRCVHALQDNIFESILAQTSGQLCSANFAPPFIRYQSRVPGMSTGAGVEEVTDQKVADEDEDEDPGNEEAEQDEDLGDDEVGHSREERLREAVGRVDLLKAMGGRANATRIFLRDAENGEVIRGLKRHVT